MSQKIDLVTATKEECVEFIKKQNQRLKVLETRAKELQDNFISEQQQNEDLKSQLANLTRITEDYRQRALEADRLLGNRRNQQTDFETSDSNGLIIKQLQENLKEKNKDIEEMKNIQEDLLKKYQEVTSENIELKNKAKEREDLILLLENKLANVKTRLLKLEEEKDNKDFSLGSNSSNSNSPTTAAIGSSSSLSTGSLNLHSAMEVKYSELIQSLQRQLQEKDSKIAQVLEEKNSALKRFSEEQENRHSLERRLLKISDGNGASNDSSDSAEIISKLRTELAHLHAQNQLLQQLPKIQDSSSPNKLQENSFAETGLRTTISRLIEENKQLKQYQTTQTAQKLSEELQQERKLRENLENEVLVQRKETENYKHLIQSLEVTINDQKARVESLEKLTTQQKMEIQNQKQNPPTDPEILESLKLEKNFLQRKLQEEREKVLELEYQQKNSRNSTGEHTSTILAGGIQEENQRLKKEQEKRKESMEAAEKMLEGALAVLRQMRNL